MGAGAATVCRRRSGLTRTFAKRGRGERPGPRPGRRSTRPDLRPRRDTAAALGTDVVRPPVREARRRPRNAGEGPPPAFPGGGPPASGYEVSPCSRKLKKPVSETIRWSRSGIPNSSPDRTSLRVASLSSADGVQSPEGWLCYVERPLMLSNRSESLLDRRNIERSVDGRDVLAAHKQVCSVA